MILLRRIHFLLPIYDKSFAYFLEFSRLFDFHELNRIYSVSGAFKFISVSLQENEKLKSNLKIPKLRKNIFYWITSGQITQNTNISNKQLPLPDAIFAFSLFLLRGFHPIFVYRNCVWLRNFWVIYLVYFLHFLQHFKNILRFRFIELILIFVKRYF